MTAHTRTARPVTYAAIIAPFSRLAVRLWHMDGSRFVELFSLPLEEDNPVHSKYHILVENTRNKRVKANLKFEGLCKNTWKELKLIFVHFTKNRFVYKLALRGKEVSLKSIEKIRVIVRCLEEIKTLALEENKIPLKLLRELPQRLKKSVINFLESKQDRFLEVVEAEADRSEKEKQEKQGPETPGNPSPSFPSM